ncbi:response regulator [Bacteriovorax sp. Seq25_V]|uniref:response regulator n=1 Tax=Bacteriovorax sp. Seq25_V TaxID=1201288 RepID=UPI000389DA34|nr:response regulator [Bacteriovorax sp. Seq25_V]EQC47259.1 response regulator receiver domain protein [Bacteriovorax sp. Seq25_V]
MDLAELKENFILEAEDLLEDAEDALLSVGKSEYSGLFNRIFRSFHSLKGAAGMFGFVDLQEHVHKLENSLDSCREAMNEERVDYYLRGIDAVREYFRDGTISFKEQVTREEVKVDIKEKRQVQEEKKVSTPHKSSGYIYVVDDEKIIVELISSQLISSGFTVKSFYDGAELLEEISSEHLPDVIVSDINMPKVNGIEMAKKLAERGIAIPIVYVSAYVTLDIVLSGLKSRMCYFIEKPYDEKVLISIVTSLADNSKLKKSLMKTCDRIMFMFSNHENFLLESGHEKEASALRYEIENLLDLKKSITK